MNPDGDREIIIGSKTVHSSKGKRVFATSGRIIGLYSRNYASDMGSSAKHKAGNEKGKRLKVHDFTTDQSDLMIAFYTYLAL